MGPGSLHNTLTHMLAAMCGWTDLLAGRALRPRIDQDAVSRTPADLSKLFDETANDFANFVRSHPLDEIVSARNEAGKCTPSRATRC